MLLATLSLWRRDVVRFLRQPSRIIGAIGSPLLFWLLIGSGLQHSFQGGPGGPDYLRFFYPGALAMVVLFTAIFSTISVIEDRDQGFLQGVLVSPAPRLAIVAGKLLGGTTLAVLQAALFLTLAPLAIDGLSIGRVAGALAVCVGLGFGLTGLGFAIAWGMDSAQGFHAIMNLFLIPMWLLSSAAFPIGGAAGWVRSLMLVNPMTYGVALLRRSIVGFPAPGDPDATVALSVTVAFAALMAVVCAAMIARPRHR